MALGSDEEKALLEELRAEVGKVDGCQGVNTFWQLAALRSRKFDIGMTVKTLSAYMVWRETCSVDRLGSVENENLRDLLASGFIQPWAVKSFPRSPAYFL